MDLNRPESLIALALLPVLWWLARPPRPRRVVETAHLPQWRAALERLRRRDVRFRRLRFWLLAGAFALTSLAAAAPEVGVLGGARVLAIVLDGSPSMAAREPDGSTAFDLARARVEAALAGLPPGIEIRLGVAGAVGAPIVVRGDAAAVGERLPSLRPAEHGAGADLAAVVEQLVAPGVAVWTITDARGAANDLPLRGALDVVGAGDLANRAITRLEVEDRWPLPEIDLAIEVRTFPPAGSFPGVAVEGGVDAELPRVSPVGPGAWRAELRAQRRGGGLVNVRIGGTDVDPQPADDVASVVLPPPAAPVIGVVRGVGTDGSDGTDWVGRAAALLADSSGGTVVAAARAGDRVDLMLVDGGVLDAAPPHACTFGTAFGPSAAELGPRISDWDRRHPLTAGLDLSELTVRVALGAGGLPADGTVVLSGDHGALAVAVDGGDGARSIHFGFRLQDSNLPLLPAFPQLLRRAFLWLSHDRIPERAVRVADPTEVDLRRPNPAVRRPLPAFARPGTSLAAPLLLIALALVAGRAYAR